MDILELSEPEVGGDRAAVVLEAGGLVVFPQLAFALSPEERRLCDPAISDGRAKNVSLDPVSGRVSGSNVDDATTAVLHAMLTRFADTAEALLDTLTPRYAGALQRRRTSFRPGAIADRALSRRKDDRRLHTDAFPANPTQGRRILRVFANVDPAGQARVWEVGETDFATLAAHYGDRLTTGAGAAWLMQKLKLTKGRRSHYDQAMLRLHDAAKLDDTFQATTPRRRIAFPAGCMWVVYTDCVLHAALAGQHALEQTFLLPPDAMYAPEHAPMHILERVGGLRAA